MTDPRITRRIDGKAFAREILACLDRHYPDAHCELDYSTPLELTVAVVLSAQCTDVRVNQITPHLFAKYKTPEDYLATSQTTLEDEIRSAGFFRQKAKSIRGIMAAIVERHGGRIPDAMEELVALPGIGRKTANVILANAFNKAEGIAVDTHVGRVARRLGLTRRDDPDKVERDLLKIFPQSSWGRINHLIVFHGRYTCKARKPACDRCPLATICPYVRKIREGSSETLS